MAGSSVIDRIHPEKDLIRTDAPPPLDVEAVTQNLKQNFPFSASIEIGKEKSQMPAPKAGPIRAAIGNSPKS